MQKKFRFGRYLACFAATCLMTALPVNGIHAESLAEFAHENSDIESDPRVIYGKLENGLRYAVMHNDTPSGVAALRMRINTGSLNETERQRGLAHFLEHMAFNGSKNVPEGEMIKRLERKGLSFGADTNASTGFDQTVYKLNLPSTAQSVVDEAFFLMRETAENLTLDADAIERERGVIAAEKRARDSVPFRALIAGLNFFTEGSRLEHRLPIGTDEAIASMARADFVDYYRGYYRPENTFIVFVGDFDTDWGRKKIIEFFGDWKSDGEALPAAEILQANIVPGKTGYHQDDELLTNITLGALYSYEDGPDSRKKRDKAILRTLGNEILNRRLQRILDQGDARFLSAVASRYTTQKVVDGMTLRLRTAPEKWEQGLAAGDLEVRRALEHGFSQAELDEEVSRMRSGLQTVAATANTRKTYAGFEYNYAQALVESFSKERVFTSPAYDLQEFERLVGQIEVVDVERAFRESWRGYQNPYLYLTTANLPENPEKAMGSALLASRKVAAIAPVEAERQEFAYTDFGTPGEIREQHYLEDIDTYLIGYRNNVRLNFKQTGFEKNTINISVKVGGGFLSMPRKDEGLRRLGLNLLSKSGVDGHTAVDLRSIFAGSRVNTLIRTRLDEDAFEIVGRTSREDLGKQLNLMAAHVVAPAFREQVARQYFESMKAWYPTHRATAETVADKELPRLIRSGDARYGHSDLDSFLKPTVEEVRTWIEPQVKDGFLEITIVGDVDRETVIREMARTFGALAERPETKEDFPTMRQLQFPTGSPTPFRYYHGGNPEQALVRVYWPAPDAQDPANGYRMQVLQGIFRNRLTNVLREEMGATYSPGVGAFSNELFDGFGYVFANVTSAPEEVETVRRAVLAVASELGRKTIGEDVFQRAIGPIIADLDSLLENDRYWMNVLGDAQTGKSGIQSHRLLKSTFLNMKVEDVNALAAEVFRNDKAVSAYIQHESWRPED